MLIIGKLSRILTFSTNVQTPILSRHTLYVCRYTLIGTEMNNFIGNVQQGQ
jgi:hypothetical protein